MDLLQYLISLPLGFAQDSVQGLLSWIGNCYSGSCGSFPNEVWSSFGDTVSSIGSLLASAGGLLWTGIFYFLPPGGGLPQVFHDSAIYFGNSLATINFLLPVNVLVYCMTLVISVKMTLWAFHVLRVVVSFVRGVPVAKYQAYF